MPIIQIQMLGGRAPEKKERLIAEVSDSVARILEVPLERVRVLITEIPPEHWGVAGRPVAQREGKSDG
ncbi:MAG TPA: 2-hydroxymuconate tautomerase family protein [Pyrinomonadaceae bacterium]|nr:2-hydroxymuconate tautomerase family protein [Pyrinomonadaceae bacterium]